MFGPAVYILGILITLACAVLLLRAFSRVRKSLLLWSGLCFVGLTISNLVTFVDLVMFPNIDLYFWRLVTAAIATVLLVYGLIWDSR